MSTLDEIAGRDADLPLPDVPTNPFQQAAADRRYLLAVVRGLADLDRFRFTAIGMEWAADGEYVEFAQVAGLSVQPIQPTGSRLLEGGEDLRDDPTLTEGSDRT